MSAEIQQTTNPNGMNDVAVEQTEAGSHEAAFTKIAGLNVVVGAASLFGVFAVVLVVLTHFVG